MRITSQRLTDRAVYLPAIRSVTVTCSRAGVIVPASIQMPLAQFGRLVAHMGLDDGQRAQAALKELVASYPNSPEAAQAKDRLQKLAAATPKAAGG